MPAIWYLNHKLNICGITQGEVRLFAGSLPGSDDAGRYMLQSHRWRCVR